MRNYVIINGVNSNTINGLAINELPPITKPPMRVLQEEIDGRDGDITTNLGYGAYDKVMTIGLFHTFDINQIIAFFNGAGTIVFSNEPDKKYNYKIIDQIDYEKLISFKTATVTLHCQPFKYPLEETPLIIEPTIDTLENVTSASIETNENTLNISLKGNTTQDGTPTPSTPIPINVVTGDNEVVVCGKNLFGNLTRGYIGNNGEIITGNTNDKITPYITTQANKTYWLTGLSGSYSRGAVYDQNKNFISEVLANSAGNTRSFITPNNACYLLVSVSDYNDTKQIQLEQNSQATSYEPYQSQTYPINLPVENLFDVSSITENTYLDEHGGSGSSGVTNLSDYIDIGNNSKCTLSYDYSSLLNNVSRALCFYNSSKTYLSGLSYTPTNKTTTFNIPSNTKYVRFAYDKNCYDIQLEKGSKKNTYTPYGTTPIELCKTENNQEYIYKDNDKWYLHKETGKETYVGTESNWYKQDSWSAVGNNTSAFYRAKPSEAKGDTNTYSNYFIRNTSITSVDTPCMNLGGTNIIFRINKSLADTTDSFKTWLVSNNVEVRYILTTPTNTEITDTELIEQLDSLMSATTYYGITNINQQNNDLPFIMDLSYMVKDTDKVIVDNIGNIYSKPTIALEGNGTGGIYLNDNQILSVELTDKMTISISDMEAFDPDTHALLNRAVTGNYNSMTLQPNENTIKITGGITKATITDYTRWL